MLSYIKLSTKLKKWSNDSWKGVTESHEGRKDLGPLFVLGNLTFRGPCIMTYSFNKTNEMH